MSKDWTEIMRVHWSVAIIFPFWVDVPSSSEGIQFGTKMSGMEANYEVELREVLQPSCLSVR